MNRMEESKVVEYCSHIGLTPGQIEEVKSMEPANRGSLAYKIFEITDGEITRAEIARGLNIHYNTVNEMCKKHCPEKIKKRKWVREVDDFYESNSGKSYVITKTGKFYLKTLGRMHRDLGIEENHRISFLKDVRKPKSLEEIKKSYGYTGVQKVRTFLDQNIVKEHEPGK